MHVPTCAGLVPVADLHPPRSPQRSPVYYIHNSWQAVPWRGRAAPAWASSLAWTLCKRNRRSRRLNLPGGLGAKIYTWDFSAIHRSWHA